MNNKFKTGLLFLIIFAAILFTSYPAEAIKFSKARMVGDAKAAGGIGAAMEIDKTKCQTDECKVILDRLTPINQALDIYDVEIDRLISKVKDKPDVDSLLKQIDKIQKKIDSETETNLQFDSTNLEQEKNLKILELVEVSSKHNPDIKSTWFIMLPQISEKSTLMEQLTNTADYSKGLKEQNKPINGIEED
ncbi:MAG: hypothetical protein AB1782_14615 [Cyanobacteriota bacterium]